jgi:methionyl-tRNA formyltransferase
MSSALLIGLGPTALAALESLSAKLDVVGLVRNADGDELDNWVPGRRPGDRPDDVVARRAGELGVPLCTDTSPGAIQRLLLRTRPDCVVVSSYDRVLRPELLALSRFVNVHDTPLPRYRGRGVWSLINDEPFTALTIHVLDAGLDTGDVLFQELVPIRATDTVMDLYERVNEVQRAHLGDTVLRHLGGYEGLPQRHEAATYGCSSDRDVPEDGEIDWSWPTRRIDCLVRGLAYPFPGAHTYFAGRRLTIWSARLALDAPRYAGRVPGRVVSVSRQDGWIDVLTGDGTLRVLEVQPEGAERMAPAGPIRSVSDTLGMRTADLLRRIDALEQQVARLMKG